MKKICIVSDVIGNRDVIKNGKNGYVAKNLEEYIQIIKQWINRKDTERIVIEGWSDIQEKFNIENMAKKYKVEYEE